jgi:hypothetical protein
MSFKSRALGLTAVLLVLGWGGSAQAQYLLTGNSGGELQIGTGLPLPVGPTGIFFGGMTPVNGGTSCGMGPGGCTASPDGPGTAFWPPLLVPPNPNVTSAGTITRTIMAAPVTAGGGGGTLNIPTAVLAQPAPGNQAKIGVFPTNPAVFQVATTISYAWPAAAATFAPGGAPGPLVTGTPLVGGVITFSGGTKAFGGPAQFSFAPGPGSGTGAVAPNGLGVFPVASVWINFQGMLPTQATRAGLVGASNPVGLGQPGAPLGAPAGTTMFGIVSPGIVSINQTSGGVCTNFCLNALGSIPSSAILPAPFGLTNMVTGSKGFPWTTGFITLSQPAAVPPEIFFMSGMDNRAPGPGTGNVSLVSGALSQRNLSGPNGNRGWLRLNVPEPTAALGVAGALAMLGLCHGLVRRRSR